jgi:hypothetical protein
MPKVLKVGERVRNLKPNSSLFLRISLTPDLLETGIKNINENKRDKEIP